MSDYSEAREQIRKAYPEIESLEPLNLRQREVIALERIADALDMLVRLTPGRTTVSIIPFGEENR